MIIVLPDGRTENDVEEARSIAPRLAMLAMYLRGDRPSSSHAPTVTGCLCHIPSGTCRSGFHLLHAVYFCRFYVFLSLSFRLHCVRFVPVVVVRKGGGMLLVQRGWVVLIVSSLMGYGMGTWADGSQTIVWFTIA